MNDTGLVTLAVRALVSLAIVLAVVGVAYLVARRRANGGGSPVRSPGRTSGRRRATAPGIEVVGRVGLGRSSAAVAVRFGDRVVLIASSESGPTTTLAEMPAERWDELRTIREPIETRAIGGARPLATAPPSLLEALRQATARHA
jgi:hypothetical protein